MTTINKVKQLVNQEFNNNFTNADWCSYNKIAQIQGKDQGKHHTAAVRQVAFSHDGSLIASASWDKTVKIWSYSSKQEVHTFKGHTGEVWSVAFSHDGKILASGGKDNLIKLWNIESKQEIHTFKGHTDCVNSLCFSPDGKKLASGSSDSNVKLWDLTTKQEITTLKGHTDQVFSVTFSPDGLSIASSSADKLIKLWCVETLKEIKTIYGHDGWVYQVSFSPDGKKLASACRDNTVKVWNVSTAKELNNFIGHAFCIYAAIFAPDGKTVISASEDKTIKIWSLETNHIVHTFKGHEDWTFTVAISPDGKTLVSGARDKTIKLWNIDTLQEVAVYKGHTNDVFAAAFTPDGKFMASGGRDTTVKLWNVQTKQVLHTFVGHTDCILTIAISPDGKMIASGSIDKMLKLWSIEKKQEIHTFKDHGSDVQSVNFTPDGKILACGVDDSIMKYYDVETKKEIHCFKEHKNCVNSVVFSSDGKLMASGCCDFSIKLWDVETRKEIITFWGHTNCINALAISPDCKVLASAAGDNIIKLWDLSTMQEIHTFREHHGSVRSIAFSPNGKLLASASEDKSIKIFNLETKEEIHAFTESNDWVLYVSFSADGKKLAGSSKDKLIRVYDIETTLKDSFKQEVEQIHVSSDGLFILYEMTNKEIKIFDSKQSNFKEFLNNEEEQTFVKKTFKSLTESNYQFNRFNPQAFAKLSKQFGWPSQPYFMAQVPYFLEMLKSIQYYPEDKIVKLLQNPDFLKDNYLLKKITTGYFSYYIGFNKKLSLLNYLLYLDDPQLLKTYLRLISLANIMRPKQICKLSLSEDCFGNCPFTIAYEGQHFRCSDIMVECFAQNFNTFFPSPFIYLHEKNICKLFYQGELTTYGAQLIQKGLITVPLKSIENKEILGEPNYLKAFSSIYLSENNLKELTTTKKRKYYGEPKVVPIKGIVSPQNKFFQKLSGLPQDHPIYKDPLVIQQCCDIKWYSYARRIFRRDFFAFILFGILFAMTTFCKHKEEGNETSEKKNCCCCKKTIEYIQIIIMLFFAHKEFTALCRNCCKQFCNIWNVIDFLFALITLVYVILNQVHQGEKCCCLKILRAKAIILYGIKSISYFRACPHCSFIVNMIVQVFKKIKPIVFIMIQVLLIFSLAILSLIKDKINIPTSFDALLQSSKFFSIIIIALFFISLALINLFITFIGEEYKQAYKNKNIIFLQQRINIIASIESKMCCGQRSKFEKIYQNKFIFSFLRHADKTLDLSQQLESFEQNLAIQQNKLEQNQKCLQQSHIHLENKLQKITEKIEKVLENQ